MVSTIALLATLSSVGLISLAPNLILLLFPNIANSDPRGNAILVTGQALAAGGLMGDVFLHILSHATNYEQENVGLWILLGFTIFLVVDMILRTVHSHDHSSSHTHSHDHQDDKDDKTANGESTPPQTTTTTELLFTPAVLLNIAGDALHNFTDGLAIGASFATFAVTHDKVTFASLMASQGGLATISILFHEIPHELGDYCVLLKGGFSKRSAILTQFMTAIAAMVGSLVGLWAVEGYGSHSMVYLTAGGFVYLAAVTILPQVLDEHASAKLRFVQLLAFCTGIAFMYAVLLLEDHDHDGHDHSHGHGHDSEAREVHLHHSHEHEAHQSHHEHVAHHHEL